MAMEFHGLRLLTARPEGRRPGRGAADRQAAWAASSTTSSRRFAIDALGELGILYDDVAASARQAATGRRSYMFDLGLIIGGGTAQIQKNIISERGLGMPREPKAAKA